jgi:hypothetical protein
VIKTGKPPNPFLGRAGPKNELLLAQEARQAHIVVQQISTRWRLYLSSAWAKRGFFYEANARARTLTKLRLLRTRAN